MSKAQPDINDTLRDDGLDAVRQRSDQAYKKNREREARPRDGIWPEPRPLPNGLPPVDAFSFDFLPREIAPWVADISERLQCPPDYVAVGSMTALGSLIGRRCAVKPQMRTDWIEVPNVWGGFIGRPGMLKSPAMNEGLRPLHRLEADAEKDYEIALQAYKAQVDAFKLRKAVNETLTKSALKKNPGAKIDIELDEPDEPVAVRYRTNDCSYESLGELLIDNPSGILVERDELISLLAHLDREEQAVARGFYLSGWSGTQPYTFDRIARGHRHVEAACISVLGGTQPARIGEYVRRANAGGAGGDGLIQRFGLLVWPDASAEWQDVDDYPDSSARAAAWEVFERLAKVDDAAAFALGAQRGPFDRLPALRLDDAAHADFLGWRQDLERRLRSGDLSPALEGHLAKYRKLVPALALIDHLCDGRPGPVPGDSMLRALAFATYLETHARRVYAACDEGERGAARAILRRIRAGALADGFSGRDIQRHDWSELTDREAIQRGLDLLADLDWIVPQPTPKGVQGRPSVRYLINPKGARP